MLGDRKTRQLTEFGKLAKKALVDKNIKQVDLANELGVDVSYLGQIFYGERSGRKYLTRIAKVLEIEVPIQ